MPLIDLCYQMILEGNFGIQDKPYGFLVCFLHFHSFNADTYYSFLPIINSDNSPIIIDFYQESKKLFFPFRFFEAWSKEDSCRDTVLQAQKITISGCASFQLLCRLCSTRKALSFWNKRTFLNCNAKLAQLIGEIGEIQKRPPTQENLTEEAFLQMEYLMTMENLQSI